MKLAPKHAGGLRPIYYYYYYY